jgi:hypothetical protein
LGRSRSHLFTVRVWAEEPSPGAREYRGEVTHLLSGARRPFRAWTDLEEFLVGTLEADAGRTSGDRRAVGPGSTSE